MKLRPQYAPLLACPYCGSPCEEVGKTLDYPDGTHTFTPEPIERECRPDARYARKRQAPGRDVYNNKTGRTEHKDGRVYFVQVHSHLCTRHKTAEDPRPECGVILLDLLKPFPGDVPEWCYYAEGGSHGVSAAVAAMKERTR